MFFFHHHTLAKRRYLLLLNSPLLHPLAQRRAFSDKVRHPLLNCSTAQLSREAPPSIKKRDILIHSVTKRELAPRPTLDTIRNFL
jgi:hypothetical protein